MIGSLNFSEVNTLGALAGVQPGKQPQTLGDFLTLLTTQLKNQDPANPLNADQVTQQVASMSQMEQQAATNKSLEQMLSLLTGAQLTSAAGYIGKSVTAEGNVSMLGEHGAAFVYDLADSATQATLTIADAQGQVVFSGPAPTKAGRNTVNWEGLNLFTGETMPPGAYTFSIAAQDAAGNDIPVRTYASGIVTGVEMQEGKAVLALGEMKVPLEKVQAVGQAQFLQDNT